VLQAAYNISRNSKAKDMVKPTQTKVISSAEFVQMQAVNLSLEFDKKKAPGGGRNFATDTEISGSGAFGERQLQKFEFDGDLDMFALDGKSGDNSSWDQFAVNKEKFGVTSDFQEETYTTKLDMSKLSAEQQKKAASLARDIEDDQRRQSGVYLCLPGSFFRLSRARSQ